MDLSIFLIVLQDDVVNGAIYAMLAIAIILTFEVTCVILFFEGGVISRPTSTFKLVNDMSVFDNVALGAHCLSA